MAQPRNHVVPFQTGLLGNPTNCSVDNLFPATMRTPEDDISGLASQTNSNLDIVQKFLKQDLSVAKLEAILPWLYLAGRPMPPRHLGYQQVLGRIVVLTEKMDLHLVWKNDRIFIKPLPKYLLSESVWMRFLLGSSKPSSLVSPASPSACIKPQEDIAKVARGFLLSYCALISFESDFRSAKDLGLLPQEIDWHDWRSWTKDVLDLSSKGKASVINPRFYYGELRLGRLNKIYIFFRGEVLRGYARIDSASTTAELLRENFVALASILSYTVIVLTAMQTGLATDHLRNSLVFQGASWGFTVLSIISPLAALMFILGLFAIYFHHNWTASMAYEKKRFEHMGIEPPSKKKHVNKRKEDSNHV